MNALLVSHRASSAVWVATSVHRQPFVPLHRATALCGCLYASLHNDFGRPPSCILCTFMNALLVSHPCETLGVHFIRHPCLTRKLRVLPPAAPKIIPRLLSRRKCSGVVELRSLGSLHLCIDSHLCRCIVQRLCVAVFMHPCITTLCDRYRASLHDPHSASSPPSTKKSRAMPVCVSGSVAGCRIAVVWVAASCSDSVRPLSCIHARPASCVFSHPPIHKKCNPTH